MKKKLFGKRHDTNVHNVVIIGFYLSVFILCIYHFGHEFIVTFFGK